MRQQCGFGSNAKPHHFFGGHGGDLGDLLGRGVVVDVGVHDEQLPVGQHQAVHGCVGGDTRAFADHLVDVIQVVGRVAPGAANQAIDFTLLQQHGADQ